MTRSNPFDLSASSVLVTGGTGTLGSAIAIGLGEMGARLALLGRDSTRLATAASNLSARGIECLCLTADVLDRDSLETSHDQLLEEWGSLDVLVHAAGGNIPAATSAPDASFLDLDPDAFRAVVDLNLMGALLPIQVFGPALVESGHGSVITLSSMAASRPLTRVAGYGAAKAALENLTCWLAVDAAKRYGDSLRVNAVAPGFLLSDQNRDLLLRPDGSPSERGRAILAHTPMARFGEPEDLVGAVAWLASGTSSFVTGAVIPVDGGFSAFAGV